MGSRETAAPVSGGRADPGAFDISADIARQAT